MRPRPPRPRPRPRAPAPALSPTLPALGALRTGHCRCRARGAQDPHRRQHGPQFPRERVGRGQVHAWTWGRAWLWGSRSNPEGLPGGGGAVTVSQPPPPPFKQQLQRLPGLQGQEPAPTPGPAIGWPKQPVQRQGPRAAPPADPGIRVRDGTPAGRPRLPAAPGMALTLGPRRDPQPWARLPPGHPGHGQFPELGDISAHSRVQERADVLCLCRRPSFFILTPGTTAHLHFAEQGVGAAAKDSLMRQPLPQRPGGGAGGRAGP